MQIYAVLVLIGLLALQLAPGVNLVARAQQSGNTDGTGNNATLDITYPPRVTTGPKQLCHSENGVRSQVNKDIHSILRNKVLPRLCAKGHSETNPAASCNEQFREGCHSGYYWISANDSSVVQVYCDMNTRCCNNAGGWMRVANLNMTDHKQHCPNGWREVANPKRLCRRASRSYVNSVVFNTYGIPYSQVCGSIIGYQYGTPAGFFHYNENPNAFSLENSYVDGVSVTYGIQGERRHIWTFVCARSKRAGGAVACPCTRPNNAVHIPPWVRSDYFCESGTNTSAQAHVLYLTDPLWDGKGCGNTSTCCSYNQPPWFCKQLSETTSENIEVRLLAYHGSPNYLDTRDTPIQSIELYVQ